MKRVPFCGANSIRQFKKNNYLRMKLYTKTGDKGQTGLIGGTRVSKADIRLDAYGSVDELNAYIGLLATQDQKPEHVEFLQKIQNLLFNIGSNLATDTSKTDLNHVSVMKEEYISAIEQEIDRIDSQLSPLNHFILPGGSSKAALCHVCRTVARRAERRIIEMNNMYNVDNNIIVFVNRLSDYFFALSRLLLIEEQKQEIFWKQTI